MFLIDIWFEKCVRVILENGGMLKFIPDCCKNQKMCNNAVDNYAHELVFVPVCCVTQKISNKTVDT